MGSEVVVTAGEFARSWFSKTFFIFRLGCLEVIDSGVDCRVCAAHFEPEMVTTVSSSLENIAVPTLNLR